MRYAFAILMFLFAASSLLADQSDSVNVSVTPTIFLALDYDLQFRTAYYSNIDYTSAKHNSADIFSQYLNLNVIGKFDKRIEMSAKIASYGFSGKYDNAFAMPYEDKDFPFFLETAFLKFKTEKDFSFPYTIYIGKQEFHYGSGLVVDSDNTGLLGAEATVELSKFLIIDMFASKVPNENFNFCGANFNFDSFIEFTICQERNNSGFLYKKGVSTKNSENPSNKIEYDNKTFYDLRIARVGEKYDYVVEAAQQKGYLSKDNAQKIDYDAYMFSLNGAWHGEVLKKDANANILFTYSGAKEENCFSPTFAKRYDGLQRIGYGALFAANTTDSFVVIPNGYYGINTLGFSFGICPLNAVSAGIAYFLFSASDAPADAGDAGFAKIYGAKADLGKEFDFFVKYKYKHYFDVIFDFALYTPPSKADKVFANMDSSYLFQLGIISRF
ncbi:MAG: hypothetical protein LBD98_02750 [Endomicrobium sp.]|jgi:hypothetical protein|nr:hypothetical protein [Endomicrobium sp.]